MQKSKAKNQRVLVTFTASQLNLLDGVVANGKLGSNRAEVVKEIILQYFGRNNLL